MKDKRKILICVDWYTPGYKAGGPIRSVSNMVSSLKFDFEFYVLTSAFDLGDSTPYPDVIIGQWHDQDGVFVKYLDKTSLNYPSIKSNIFEVNPDFIYLNSMFSTVFTLYPLRYARKVAKNVILAPRGMLGKGALEIKHGKKKAFLSTAKILGWYKNIIWHATAQEEADEIKQVFGEHSKIKIAQNIPVKQVYILDEIKKYKQSEVVKFVFMSRVCKKKNLHLAINALKSITLTQPVELNIYGINEDHSYFDSIKADFGKISSFLTITYHGGVPPSEIPEILAKSNYMVLPTKHENFGHTIVEAWANGCPVIISQFTPWHNLSEKNIGWDIDINKSGELEKTMDIAINISPEQYNKKVESSYNYFASTVMNNQLVEDHKKLFS